MLQPVHAGICSTPHRTREHALLQLGAGLPLNHSSSIAVDLPRPGTEHGVLSPVSSTSHTYVARRTTGEYRKAGWRFPLNVCLQHLAFQKAFNRAQQGEAPFLQPNATRELGPSSSSHLYHPPHWPQCFFFPHHFPHHTPAPGTKSQQLPLSSPLLAQLILGHLLPVLQLHSFTVGVSSIPSVVPASLLSQPPLHLLLCFTVSRSA